MQIVQRLAALLLCIPMLAHAGVQLVVDGVEDPLKLAVSSGVDLSEYANREVTEAQVRRLYAQSLDQAKTSLEPYGYYEAKVQGQLEPVGNDWRVTLHVTPGEPVKVTGVEIKLDPTAAKIGAIRRAQRAIENLKGQTLNHGEYDSSRDALSGALTANGFLDARLVTHRVDVNRGERSAIIYTIIESCRRRGLDPFTYLRDVLTELPRTTNWQVKNLTPAAWQKSRHANSLTAAA